MPVARTKPPVYEAKAQVLDAIRHGAKVADAVAAVGRTEKAYELWRANDPKFKADVDSVREARRSAKERGIDEDLKTLTFAEFRKQFLDLDTYAHQQQWIDALEGKDPQPIEGCEWDPRQPNRLVVNVPPFHSKSQTLTVDYATYRICMNPNVRIIIISKRAEQAQKFLYQIKQRLTSTRFAKLQAAYAPPGGFKPATGEGQFSQKVMYVSGRTSDHKDPTVEVLGIGSQIYGSRADLIILDDCVVLSNANEFEKQITWLESEVENRVKNGTILVVGTRLASQDLYSELRNDDRYLSGRSPWSYLRQPMVLAFADEPAKWKTLWPRTSTPMDESDTTPDADGLYTAWDGVAAARVRDSKPPAVWSLVYQQQQTAEDAVFKPACVMGSIDRRRKPGALTPGAWGHPRNGKQGMFTIASMDPAMSGDTFTVVGSIDRNSQKRYIENAWVQTAPSVEYFREHIKSVTEEYKVDEWVIEEQGFQGFLVHDPEINRWLQTRGVRMVGHYSGSNKTDPDFGVASVATLFGSVRRINDGAGREVFNGDNLIDLPDPDKSQGIKTLIEELLTWIPGKRGSKLRQDGPMALWFFETRARVYLGLNVSGSQQKYVRLPFMNRGDLSKQAATPFGFSTRRLVG